VVEPKWVDPEIMIVWMDGREGGREDKMPISSMI
jgi:hypothetical protein